MENLGKLIWISPGKPAGLKGKMAQLYQGLANKRWKNDQDARDDLFGNDSHRSIYYANLKRELAEILMTQIITSGSNSEDSKILQSYDACYKKFAIIKMLIARGVRGSAIGLAEKTFKQSRKYDFTELSLSLAVLLRKHFGLIDPHKSKYEFYKNEAIFLQKLYSAEELAEQLHTDLLYRFSKSIAFDKEIAEKGEEYVGQLKPLLQEFPSFKLHYTANNILVTIYQLRSQHDVVISTCESALNFLRSQPDTRKSAIFSFQYKMIPSFIQLGNFEKAHETIHRCLEISSEGSHNWIITKRYEVMLGFYSSNYNLACDTIKAVKNKLKTGRHLLEHWLIYEAYAEFLIGEELSQRTFRLSKFLNEIPNFSNDKRGMNINLLIIQILFLLKRGKKGKIIDQAEALQRYTYRHLKPDHTFRSNCFIKMLLLLPSCHFNRIAVERKSSDLWQRLQSVPIDLAKQDHDLEVVPYEVLWEKVLEMLD